MYAVAVQPPPLFVVPPACWSYLGPLEHLIVILWHPLKFILRIAVGMLIVKVKQILLKAWHVTGWWVLWGDGCHEVLDGWMVGEVLHNYTTPITLPRPCDMTRRI